MTNRLSRQINKKTFELSNERKFINQIRKLSVKKLVSDNTKNVNVIQVNQTVQNKTKQYRQG